MRKYQRKLLRKYKTDLAILGVVDKAFRRASRKMVKSFVFKKDFSGLSTFDE